MVDPQLLEILACPACKTEVRLEGDRLVCVQCGRRYPIRDGGGQGGLPVIHVPDGAHVHVGFSAFEFLLAHVFSPPYVDINQLKVKN